ncbi:MAG: hypothetical protein NZ899_05295 [Thermoguttaceae bacterium]|nr:hypothetical protein [Thermoguttaceae bacterium]MDW8078268.1 hypothetical protein [Thermoguttaceae bacterium]
MLRAPFTRIIVWFLAVCLWSSATFAWGPHPEITRAALDVLPNLPEIKARLGEENVNALLQHCLLPDHRGRDLGRYYADDYLLIPAMPQHISHVMPQVEAAFEPYFRRALQALRTETPTNAARQIGPILHFVEDVGAPPHAKPNCPHHGELETWVRADLIRIEGYRPQLLGTNEEEALVGLRKRIEQLVAFSSERADRALAVFPDREKIEPIVLESALETTRVTADLLYTLFVLGLKEEDIPGTAALEVKIRAPALPGNNEQEPRVVLLGTPYATCAEADQPPGDGPWVGTARWRNLPPGTYRLVAYRPGALLAEKEVTLGPGNLTKIDLELSSTDPPGNLVYNPDFCLSTLGVDEPDRWMATPQRVGRVWQSAVVMLRPGKRYQLGVSVNEKEGVRVSFLLTTVPAGKPRSEGKTEQIVLWPAEGKQSPEPVEIAIAEGTGSASLTGQIITNLKPAQAVNNIWVVEQP